MDWYDELRVVLGVVYAIALGGVIGVERELKDKPAGFRTHMLVAGAAAFLVGTGRLVVGEAHFLAGDNDAMINMDPLRLVEAVISGVAFIGAGTIFANRDRAVVVGITTAASLLMVATLGIAVGLGYEVLALAVTIVTLLILTVLRRLEARLEQTPEE